MATTATVKLPVFVEFNGKRYDVATLALDVKMTPGGRAKLPTEREIMAALRKALR